MGLDTTHDCWHGAYSAFVRWRLELARVAGIPLMLMENFYEPPDQEMIARTRTRASAFQRSESGGFVADRNSLTAALADAAERGDAGRWESWSASFRDSLPIRWSLLKPDPLHVLLNHSDCDGLIRARDCAPLADRLAELLPLMPDGDGGGHIGNWRETTQQFIDGLRLAASKNEAVGFH